LGKVLEQITLERCIECGKVHDPSADLWLSAENFHEGIVYDDSYCNVHKPENYDNGYRKVNKESH